MTESKLDAEKNKIILSGISKRYNQKWVLENIDQTFSCGHSYSFVGHNGCGKSTLLKMIAGLTAPSCGKVHYGRPFRFSYVPEKFRTTVLTGRTYLSRMCEIDRVEKGAAKDRTEKLAEEFFLSDMLDVPMKNMSKGTLQKIGVLQALIREPDILLLDEPLSGQDQESQKVFIRKMNELRDRGTTILMSCHEKKIVEALSDEVFTIKNRRLELYCELSEKYVIFYVLPKTAQTPVWENMKRFGAGYQFREEAGKAQETVKRLIAEEWILKGMYDEDNQYVEI